jgi:hypothetical protein
LHSCGFNDTIDFVIFSDAENDEDVPSNVTIYKQTLMEFQKLASEKLGFEVNIDESYKVCDYKPAYGLIFSEYTTGYDFWGQSDLDVIYGDIRSFLSEDFLDQYDFVNPRHDYTTGCFMVFRNTPFMNNIFKRSKDYKKVFSNPIHYCFDECNFAWEQLKEGKSIFEIETEIESFTHIMKKAEANQEVRAHFDFILMEGAAGRLTFNKGKIIYQSKFEALLYHLFWFKRLYIPKKVPFKIPDIYFISQSKIYFKPKQIRVI